jgi:hypothetical protein
VPGHRHDNASRARLPAQCPPKRRGDAPHYSASLALPLPRGDQRTGGDLSPIPLDSLAWCRGVRRWSDFTV